MRNVPGAALALVIWIGASVVLRWFLGESVGPRSTSIYGPLAAPIVVLIWLYFLAIAVLIGAALNAATRALWPAVDRPRRFSRTRPAAAIRTGDKPTEMRAEPAVDAHPTSRPLTPLPPAVLDPDRSSRGRWRTRWPRSARWAPRPRRDRNRGDPAALTCVASRP